MTAIIGSLVIIAMVTANTIWSSRRTDSATSEAVSEVSSFYLEAMADHGAKTLTNLIGSNFEQMEKAVAFIAGEDVRTQDDLRHNIGMVKTLLNLNRFALVDDDNIVYTQYTTYTGRSRHSFLSEETLSDRIITTVSPYGSSKQLCLAIPTSELTLMGKHFKACFVLLDISDIVDLLALDDEGRTSFALYARNGGNLSDTELGPVISNHNFFDALKNVVPEDVWNENYANFQNEMHGSLTFASEGAEESLYYAPIPETDWELVVLIRESVIQNRIRDISKRTQRASENQIIFASTAILLLAASLLLMLRRFSKERLDEEKETSRTFQNMANTDAMTGVRNKFAYTENETAINEQIRSGEIQNLGVVVGDINGLKYVNDTQGHAAGDKLIKDACALICEYFKQGAVFRIGGDEFAVILQGKGYETMHETIDALNAKVERNIQENGVVVSIGHSHLNADDSQLRDVFERADQEMYERKKLLKEMGAKVRI